MTKVLTISFFFSFCFSFCFSQVQVSMEPRHKPVLQNQYIRLLDVFLEPGDTTFYHIHSTPSVFVYLTSNVTASQIMGREWKSDTARAGYAWYRSFTPDSVIHRVTNIDSKIFHVNDVEILSSYNPENFRAMNLPVLFESDRAIAYSINETDTAVISNRGPMVAELISDSEVTITKIKLLNETSGKTTTLSQGDHFYIEPGTTFQFTSKGTTELVLFELK